MPLPTHREPSLDDPNARKFEALAALRLRANDFEELGKQGFVCRERRGQRTYYKLRFRRQQQQVVRYLGSDVAVAEKVRKELAELQIDRRLARELAWLTMEAGQKLRETKKRLAPLLAQQGFAFHGLAVRRRRTSYEHRIVSQGIQ